MPGLTRHPPVLLPGAKKGRSRLKAGMTVQMRIFTIGYEGTTVAEFLAALQKAGVERVIDVRALPLSRRPGFSKTALRGALEEAGTEYVHLKALGTPADGRTAARAGRHSDIGAHLRGSARASRGDDAIGADARAHPRKAERAAVHRAGAGTLPSNVAAERGGRRCRGRSPLRIRLHRGYTRSALGTVRPLAGFLAGTILKKAEGEVA
jgi:hypothetical protein